MASQTMNRKAKTHKRNAGSLTGSQGSSVQAEEERRTTRRFEMSADLQDLSLHGLRRVVGGPTVGVPVGTSLGPLPPAAKVRHDHASVPPTSGRNTSSPVAGDGWQLAAHRLKRRPQAALQGAVASGEIAREPATLDSVKAVALTGGAAVVWLAVSVPYLSQRAVTALGLAAITLLAAIWIRDVEKRLRRRQGDDRHRPLGRDRLRHRPRHRRSDRSVVPGPAARPVGLGAISVGVFASASIWEWFVRQTSAGRTSVLVVGTEELATGLAEEMRRAKSGFDLLGRIGACRPERDPGGGPVPGRTSRARSGRRGAAAGSHRGASPTKRTYGLAVDSLLDGSGTGFRIAGLASFFEYALGRVRCSSITPVWFMGLLHLRQRRVRALGQARLRRADAPGSGLLITAPLLPLIALAVRGHARSDHLPPDPRGRPRAPVQDLQVPHDDRRRRAARRSRQMGEGRRAAGDAGRRLPAANAPRRAAAALQRAQGRHVDGRAETRAARADRHARGSACRSGTAGS